MVLCGLAIAVAFEKYMLDQFSQIAETNHYQVPRIGLSQRELICLVVSLFSLICLLFDAKQLSFLARFLVVTMFFVMFWVSFEAFQDFYLTHWIANQEYKAIR